MTEKQLEIFLKKITEPELFHLQNPDVPSERYKKIMKKASIDDGYVFQYDSLLTNSKIAIMKNTRFTNIFNHSHEVIEITFVYSGTCTQNIDGKIVKMKQGDICILDTNTRHSLEFLDEEDVVLNIVMQKSYFSSGFLSRLSAQGLVGNFIIHAISNNHGKNRYIYFDTEKIEDFQPLMKKICCEYFDPGICSNEIIDSYMVILFSYLVRCYAMDIIEEKSNTIVEILQYLDENFRDCTLNGLASRFGFHPNYITALLKNKVGLSFKELTQSLKMSNACFLLTNSEMPIYEIAHEVGYENLGFFYRKFRSIYSMNPNEYRKKYS